MKLLSSRTRSLLRAGLLSLVILAAPSARINAVIASPGQLSDVEVKAAYILNFVRLVNWTVVPGEHDSSRLPICALSLGELPAALKNVADGKVVGSRTIVIRVIPDPAAQNCRVVLVDDVHYRTVRSVLRPLQNSAVLTVGDGPGFVDVGGMFQLVVEDGRVLFDANLDAIRRASLDVSARLLRLARSLKGNTDGG